ncbi:Putative rRNA-processing protein EBP2-like [Durusdinium trenchii]|uniref:rRNA-processing protein EBP2-like n=1 Tax=Durusdinium trenchii TaxID=1381693 RepID=A0ABP0KA20_9DINO
MTCPARKVWPSCFRSKLNSGEYILGEEPKLDQDKDYEVQATSTRGICIAPLLLQRQSELEYKVPEGAKRVPWVDTMAIDGQTELPKGVTAKDGVKLESIFLGCPEPTQLAVKFLADCRHGFRRRSGSLQKADTATQLQTDKQMYRVRQQAAEEERRIKIVEDRKKAQAGKKFAKKAKTKKLEERAKARNAAWFAPGLCKRHLECQDKRNSLEQIAEWRNRKKTEGKNTDDQD